MAFACARVTVHLGILLGFIQWALCNSCCRKPEVTTLDCSGCSLKTIPLLNNTNITKLNLNDNLIKNIEDHAFVHLKKLKTLSLRDNPIMLFGDDVFVGLTALKTLDIYQEGYYGVAPGTFKPLLSLHNLKMGNCFSKAAVKNISPSLRMLEMSAPQSFGEEFSHLQELETLVIFGDTCSLPSITKNTFGVFAKSLRTLQVHDCQVNSLQNDSFAAFRQLHTLNFACNRDMSLAAIFAAAKMLPNTSLETLVADGVHSGSELNELKEVWFNSPKLQNLRRMSLRQTNLASLELNVIYHIPNIEFINLGYNSILTAKYGNVTKLIEFADSINVTSVDLSFFGQVVSSHYVFRHKFCMTNDIYTEDFFRKPPSYITKPESVPCCNHTFVPGSTRTTLLANNVPQSVLYLYMPSMGFPTTDVRQTHFNDDNNFLFLDASGIRVNAIYGPVSGLTKIQGVDVSNCNARYISPSFLHTFPSLVFLNASGNEPGDTAWDKVFEKSQKLKLVDISHNRLSSLPRDIFAGMPSLEKAHLGHNPLGSVDINLKNNANLEVLDLRNTSLRISENFMKELDDWQRRGRHRLQLLLQGNVFQCNCDNLSFLKWLKTTQVNVVGKDSLECVYQGRPTLMVHLDVNTLEHACRDMRRMLMAVLAPLATVAGVCLLLLTTHHFKWTLKWKFYLLRRALRYNLSASLLGGEEDPDREHYSAFISYNNDEDGDWVHDCLLPKLEDDWGLRMCIAPRDFEAGIAIAENICQAIDTSRYVLLVVTPAFVASKWCDYEMHMALVKGRQHLVIIYREEVDVCKMSATLRSLMASVNYIEFSEVEPGNSLFWTRLRDKLTSHILQ